MSHPLLCADHRYSDMVGAGGQSLTKYTCGMCERKYTCANIATPAICAECAEHYDLCRYCRMPVLSPPKTAGGAGAVQANNDRLANYKNRGRDQRAVERAARSWWRQSPEGIEADRQLEAAVEAFVWHYNKRWKKLKHS